MTKADFASNLELFVSGSRAGHPGAAGQPALLGVIAPDGRADEIWKGRIT